MSLLQPQLRLPRSARPAVFFIALVAVAATNTAAHAADAPQIVRVEEDWELEVSIPDPDTNAPQVSAVMAPTGDADWAYAEFDINHHSVPAYRAGGLQLQVWSDGRPIVVNNDPDGGVLSRPSERIRWTQSMELADGVLTFAVSAGDSQTWGAFGQDGRLTIRTAAPLANLNDYDTAVSVSNSGIGFASNRVQVLKIVAVRRYTAAGQVLVDDEPHVVFEHE